MSGTIVFPLFKKTAYFERSFETYIQNGPWNPLFLVAPHIFSGPWIPIFEAVHGSLYSERSVHPYISNRSADPYILAGPWIPIFQAVL